MPGAWFFKQYCDDIIESKCGFETCSKMFEKNIDTWPCFCNSGRTHGNTNYTHMKIKALLGAALLAAGAATSMAQSNVYSLNVVGYYNITCPANQYVLIANQLNTTNNTLGNVIPNPPPNSIFQKFNGGYTAYSFDDVDLVWTPNGNASFAPGEGGFFKSPSATTITFVGEVPQGSLTNTLPIGSYAIRGSIVPQAADVNTLGIPGEANDILQTFNGGYTAYSFDDVDLVWTPSVPSLNVGQAFFYKKAASSTQSKWIRNFTVQ
jgi:hypothetical protein